MATRQRSTTERSILKSVAGWYPGTVAVSWVGTSWTHLLLAVLLSRWVQAVWSWGVASLMAPSQVSSGYCRSGTAASVTLKHAGGVQEFTSYPPDLSIWDSHNLPSLGTIQAMLCRNASISRLHLDLPIIGKLPIIVSSLPHSFFTLLLIWDLQDNCIF